MISRERLARYIEPNDGLSDALIDDIESAACSIVGGAIGWHLGAPAERTYYLDGTGQAELYLPQSPSPSTSPTVSLAAGGGPSDAYTEFTAFVLDGQRIPRLLRTDGSAWPLGRGNVRVVMTVGYASDAGPADLSYVVEAVVDWVLRDGRRTGAAKLPPAAFEARRILPMIPGAEALLGPYRRPGFA